VRLAKSLELSSQHHQHVWNDIVKILENSSLKDQIPFVKKLANVKVAEENKEENHRKYLDETKHPNAFMCYGGGWESYKLYDDWNEEQKKKEVKTQKPVIKPKKRKS
jgi:hypothetical protein